MAEFLYFYLRGAIGFSLIVAGIASRLSPDGEHGHKAFGSLYISVGALYSMSALDPRIRLPVDLDNLIYQGLIFLLGLSLVDLSLYLFGSERVKGGRKILASAGGIYEALLVLLPLLDYVTGSATNHGNVEDGILRGPIHALAIDAAYLWPLLATVLGIGLAKWKPSDLGRENAKGRKVVTWLIVLVPVLLAILASLVLSLQVVYRWGQILVEVLLIALYLYVVKFPKALFALRTEIGKEHAKRFVMAESEIALVASRLGRIESERLPVLRESFDLKALAVLVGIPPYRLSVYFSDRLSTSFPAWRNAIRIEYVKERLLARPDLTVLDISLEAGYRSKAAFNEQFVRLVGLSPSEFRKNGRSLQAGFAKKDD